MTKPRLRGTIQSSDPVRCAVRAELVEEVRSLLPPVPEVAEEVSE